MPQAYFIREAYFILRSNISLVPKERISLSPSFSAKKKYQHPERDADIVSKSDQKVHFQAKKRKMVRRLVCSTSGSCLALIS